MLTYLRRLIEALEGIRSAQEEIARSGTAQQQLDGMPPRVAELESQMRNLQLEATELYEKVWSALKRLEKR